MEFLSSEWIDALAEAAANRRAPQPDPTADVSLTIDHVVDEIAWRITLDRGTVSVTEIPTDADLAERGVRLSMGASAATAIARRERSVLDAFIHGDLRVGGDIGLLLEQQKALAEIDDLFASVRDQIEWPSPSERAT